MSKLSLQSKSSLCVVVSLDGVASRYITPATMPTLCEIARVGAACFDARTVEPSITLPAHTSMLRGVCPSEHGILSNSDKQLCSSATSFLKQARQSGLSTAACINWRPFTSVIEEDALTQLSLIDGGYDSSEDEKILALANEAIDKRHHQLVFVYFAQADLIGHEHGWGSEQYVEALRNLDALLSQLLELLGSQDSILVSTDHGGLNTDHEQGRPEDLQTFIAVQSPMVNANGYWAQASILDIAPTIATLCSFPVDPAWQGESLLGKERPVSDALLELLVKTEAHRYGENLNMLEHALQSAAAAKAEGAEESIVLACLLHDIGHVLGDAGQWGLPSHAEIGAQAFQQFLPAEIIEPIRAHVQAKRYLVAAEPSYYAALSEASKQSLQQQNGAMSDTELSEFERTPFCQEALDLRRFDDGGKLAGLEVPGVEDYRATLNACLAKPLHIDAGFARDACRCSLCRDSSSDQSVLNVNGLHQWQVVRRNYSDERERLILRHSSGELHSCVFRKGPQCDSAVVADGRWGAEHLDVLYDNAADETKNLSDFVLTLARNGIALVNNLSSEPGQVLRFAEEIGYVRHTNYGNLFDVITEPDPINLAYSSLGLPLHTDNPYRHPTPTVQLLHCLTAAQQGGVSHFADGFRAAEILREQHPQYFSVLSETVLSFRFHDQDVDLRDRKPMIQVSPAGELVAIHVNHRSMEAPLLSLAKSQAFYSAYQAFVDILSAKDSMLELSLKTGQLIAFDNRRVLHGRAAFNVSERRHLQGCYIDIDAVHSAARKAVL